MNINKAVLCLFLLFFAVSTHAYTPQEYLSTVKKRDDGNALAKLIISGYQLGIVQTVQTIVRFNGNRIQLGENDPICVPSARAVNGDSIEKAITLMIGTPSNPQNLNTFANMPVATLAVFGLTRVFPCKD
mgnify:CR=1 FL=1